MRKKAYRILLLLFGICLCLILNTKIALAQCGVDGMQPCSTPKKTPPKQVPKKALTKPIPKPAVSKTIVTAKKSLRNISRPQIQIESLPPAPEIELVRIPAGSFMMGSNNGEPSERPVHRVDINYAFYMGKYEITQEQWVAVTGKNPSGKSLCGLNCPVEMVSWNDTRAFFARINKMQNMFLYRLPSEAEWEYAARLGTTDETYNNLDLIAWYDANSKYTTHPAGQKLANIFGLYDMNGNVGEWCEDIYYPNYGGLPTDGSANTSMGNSSLRMLRGGTWFSRKADVRSTSRGNLDLNTAVTYVGFRVAAVPR